jgi:anthranilate synthase component I
VAAFQILPLPQGSGPERLLALHARRPDAYPVLLDSAAAGTAQGRYSFLLTLPGERLTLAADTPAFLPALDAWWQRARGPQRPGDLPFGGGWFLYLGYELAAEVEPTLRLPAGGDTAAAIAWRMHGALVYDHATGRGWAVAEAAHAAALPGMLADIADATAVPGAAPGVLSVEEEPPARFIAACRQALAHIAAGDIYQANLARAWRARLLADTTHAALYAALRRANPGPFAGLADFGDFAVLSSSPERLVRLAGDRLDTRPIAGTRPRRAAADGATIAELVAHPKERAEHVMLIDLERNDLGRIAAPGSVQVDEFMAVESYAHVHHIVSNVTARARAGLTPGAVIRAMFPGGTITGCPKVRCMQLIGDVEQAPRGAYTGSMGYLALDGSLDLNILIRTLVVRERVATLHAGAGIVADSIPEHELDETRAKALGVLRALGAGP